MTYNQCEIWILQQLQTMYNAGEAAAIADWLLEEYTGKKRQLRRLMSQQQTADDALLRIENALCQLLQGKPVQYVLGYTDFYGLRFTVNESVLIPRPETEELVNWMITDCKKQQRKYAVLDIGTGSGCIPIALKKHLPNAHITTMDVSKAALQTATGNAETNNTILHFQELDFLNETAWQQLEKYDVIVSNPPYIPQQEKAAMDKNVTAWEPATALFVPDENPLLFYEKIASFGKMHLLPGGIIYLETHQDFATTVQQLFTEQNYAAELKKDMHGNDRMVKAVLANNE